MVASISARYKAPFLFYMRFKRSSHTDSCLSSFSALTSRQREALSRLGNCVNFLFHAAFCIWSLGCICI